jgi:hypothetical protein
LGLAAALALSGCHIALVSAYDDTLNQQMVTAQHDVDTLLETMVETTSPADNTKTAVTYAAQLTTYVNLNVELDAMLVRANARANNGPTVDAVTKLQTIFKRFQARHSAESALSVAYIQDTQMILDQGFSAAMAQELLKKQSS